MKTRLRHAISPIRFRGPYCVLPSLMGVFLYLAPIYSNGIITIPLAMLISGLRTLLDDQLPVIIFLIMVVTAVLPWIANGAKLGLTNRNRLLSCVLRPSWLDLLWRPIGAGLVLMIYFDVGPRILCNQHTGFVVLNQILPAVLLSLVIGSLLLPLLLNFGLPEFCGGFFKRLMRPVFTLPGHSAVACVAAWIGDNCVGILIANQQYAQGRNTLREATVIGTTFSPVSITFCVVVITQSGLIHLFLPFYLTVCLAGLIAAIVLPRLPPLSGKSDDVCGQDVPAGDATEVADMDPPQFTLAHTVRKRGTLSDLNAMAADTLSTMLILVITVLPIATVVAAAALMLAAYTPLFHYLGKPFVPLLTWLHIPEADAVSECMLVGFTDMLLPSVLAVKIESELSRFFIAVMSVVQLVYLSEPGAMLLASKIRINIWDLFTIFILRTLVTMPVVALITHLVF